ncbi:MAG: hypothetical protein ACRDDG_16260 [Cetobacterium sp.]
MSQGGNMSILITIRKKLIEHDKTITWLSKQLGMSRRTFYRKLDNNDIDLISKVSKILKKLDK